MTALSRNMVLAFWLVLGTACSALSDSTAPSKSPQGTATPPAMCDGAGGCWQPAPSGMIVTPSCPPMAECSVGVALNNRFYALGCEVVVADAVSDRVVGTGSGLYQEARVIEGLPEAWWLAVRGDFVEADAACVGGPPDGWYLLQYWDVPRNRIEDYRPRISEVVVH